MLIHFSGAWAEDRLIGFSMIYLKLCLVIAVHIIHTNIDNGKTKPGDVHIHLFGLESDENKENRQR